MAPRFRDVAYVGALSLVAVCCGAANALNSVSKSAIAGLSLSDTQWQIVASVAVGLGMFNLPAGALLDRAGPTATCLLGAGLEFAGLLIAGAAHTAPVLGFGCAVAGLGGGSAFTGVLGAAFQHGRVAVASVSIGMSLSVLLFSQAGAQGEWNHVLLAWALIAGAAQFTGVAMMAVLVGRASKLSDDDTRGVSLTACQDGGDCPTHAPAGRDAEAGEGRAIRIDRAACDHSDSTGYRSTHASMTVSRALKSAHFRLLFFVYVLAMGCSVFVLTHAAQLVDDYYSSQAGAYEFYSRYVLALWSVCVTIGNVVASVWPPCQERREVFLASVLVFTTLLFSAGAWLRHSSDSRGYSPLFGLLTGGVGFGFGTHLVNIPSMVSEHYGNEQFGFLFGVLQVGNAIGTMALPQLATYFISMETLQDEAALGQAPALEVCAALMLLGVVAALVMAQIAERRRKPAPASP